MNHYNPLTMLIIVLSFNYSHSQIGPILKQIDENSIETTTYLSKEKSTNGRTVYSIPLKTLMSLNKDSNRFVFPEIYHAYDVKMFKTAHYLEAPQNNTPQITSQSFKENNIFYKLKKYKCCNLANAFDLNDL